MDQNTNLLLAKAGEPVRWEDEEKATNDLELLRAEFRSRLYSGSPPEPKPADKNGPPLRVAQ